MHVSTMMILLFARILAGILIPSSANANRLVSYVPMPYGARILGQTLMNDGVS